MAAPGERVAAEIREKLRLPADRVHVIHNGVDTTLFSPDAGRRWKLRRELDLPDDALAFLCPARLHPQKNHAGLLRAFRAAKLPPKCRLLLAGNGNERASLEALAAELDLLESKARVDAPFVQFLGHRDDMADLYRAADAMILPSFKEGFSNAVVEGMASGLPVVATDVGGNAEALGDEGEFGVVAKTFETAELAAAIELVAADRERRERMGAGSRERAARLFSLDAMADATVRLYERLLAEDRAKKGGAANEAAKGASRG
jgi:glycosyltransferase involved in cell wall biosynthesis